MTLHFLGNGQFAQRHGGGCRRFAFARLLQFHSAALQLHRLRMPALQSHGRGQILQVMRTLSVVLALARKHLAQMHFGFVSTVGVDERVGQVVLRRQGVGGLVSP